MVAIMQTQRGAQVSFGRAVFALGALFVGAGLISSCSDSVRYRAPWCANLGDGGPYECAYYSFEQCLATTSGVGGFCERNRRYSGDSRKPQRPVPRSQ